ncbi:MAG: ketoacyl-ACP synthase III [Oscillospiraceae bacterium]|nr:ketoacyl-ACP synthase III [Oscillospiraceae bacterium]
MGINILSTGCYTPKLKITNDDLATIIDTNDEWISSRTGISSRRFSDGEPTWYMGTMAAKQAIEKAGIDPLDIGLILDSTVSGDFFTPSTGCIIQREIGAKNAAAFDISAACSGFVYSLDIAHRYFLTDPDLKYILVVANENLSYITDFTDRASCILFADGAAAVVLERSDDMFSSWIGSDGCGMKYLYAKIGQVPNPFEKDGDYPPDDTEPDAPVGVLVQNGKEVYKFAVKAMPTAVNKVLDKLHLTIDDIDIMIPHQANIRIIETAAKNLKLPMEKIFTTIDHTGNTSSASIPIALHEAVTAGAVKKGMTVCVVGFGAGLTMGAAIFKY